MVKVGIGVESPYGEYTLPFYDSGSEGRTILTCNPVAVSLGDYTLEASIAVTTGDIEGIYRRLFP